MNVGAAFGAIGAASFGYALDVQVKMENLYAACRSTNHR